MDWPTRHATAPGDLSTTAERVPGGQLAVAGTTPLADVLLAALSEQTAALSDAAAHFGKDSENSGNHQVLSLVQLESTSRTNFTISSASGAPSAGAATPLRAAAAAADVPRSPGQIEFHVNGTSVLSETSVLAAASHGSPAVSSLPRKGTRRLSWWAPSRDAERPESKEELQRRWSSGDACSESQALAASVGTAPSKSPQMSPDQAGTVTGLLARISHVGTGLRRVAQIAVDKLSTGSSRSSAHNQLCDNTDDAASQTCQTESHQGSAEKAESVQQCSPESNAQNSDSDPPQGIPAPTRLLHDKPIEFQEEERTGSCDPTAPGGQLCHSTEIEPIQQCTPKSLPAADQVSLPAYGKEMPPHSNLEALGPWAAGWLCAQEKAQQLRRKELLLHLNAGSSAPKAHRNAPSLPGRARTQEPEQLGSDAKSEESTRNRAQQSNHQATQDYARVQHSMPIASHWELVSSESEDAGGSSQSLLDEATSEPGRAAEAADKMAPPSCGTQTTQDADDSQSLHEDAPSEPGRAAEAVGKPLPPRLRAMQTTQLRGTGLASNAQFTQVQMIAPVPAPCFIDRAAADMSIAHWQQRGALLQTEIPQPMRSSSDASCLPTVAASVLAAPRRPGTLRSSCVQIPTSAVVHSGTELGGPGLWSGADITSGQPMEHQRFASQSFPSRRENVSNLLPPALTSVWPLTSPFVEGQDVTTSAVRCYGAERLVQGPWSGSSSSFAGHPGMGSTPGQSMEYHMFSPPTLPSRSGDAASQLPLTSVWPVTAPSMEVQNIVFQQLPTEAAEGTKVLATQTNGLSQSIPTQQHRAPFSGATDSLAAEWLNHSRAEDAVPCLTRVHPAPESSGPPRRQALPRSVRGRRGRDETAPSSEMDADFSFASDSQSSQAYTLTGEEHRHAASVRDTCSAVCNSVSEKSVQQGVFASHEVLSPRPPWNSYHTDCHMPEHLHASTMQCDQYPGGNPILTTVPTLDGRGSVEATASEQLMQPGVSTSLEDLAPQPPWNSPRTPCHLPQHLHDSAVHRDRHPGLNHTSAIGHTTDGRTSVGASKDLPFGMNGMGDRNRTPDPPWTVPGTVHSFSPPCRDGPLEIRWSDPQCNEAFQSGRSARGRELWLRPGHLRSAALSEESLRSLQKPPVEPHSRHLEPLQLEPLHLEPLHLEPVQVEQQHVGKRSGRSKQSRTRSVPRRRSKPKRAINSGQHTQHPQSPGMENNVFNDLSGQTLQRRPRSSKKANKIKASSVGAGSGTTHRSTNRAGSPNEQDSTKEVQNLQILTPSLALPQSDESPLYQTPQPGKSHQRAQSSSHGRPRRKVHRSAEALNSGEQRRKQRHEAHPDGRSARSQRTGPEARHAQQPAPHSVWPTEVDHQHYQSFLDTKTVAPGRRSRPSNHSLDSFEVSSSAGSTRRSDGNSDSWGGNQSWTKSKYVFSAKRPAGHIFQLGVNANGAEQVGEQQEVEGNSDWEKVGDSPHNQSQHVGRPGRDRQLAEPSPQPMHKSSPANEHTDGLFGRALHVAEHMMHTPGSHQISIGDSSRGKRSHRISRQGKTERRHHDLEQVSYVSPPGSPLNTHNYSFMGIPFHHAEHVLGLDGHHSRHAGTASSPNNRPSPHSRQAEMESSPANMASPLRKHEVARDPIAKAFKQEQAMPESPQHDLISPGLDAGSPQKSKARKKEVTRVPDIAALKQLATTKSKERARQVNTHARHSSGSSIEGVCFRDVLPHGESSGLGIAYWSSYEHVGNIDAPSPVSPTVESSPVSPTVANSQLDDPKPTAKASAVKRGETADAPVNSKEDDLHPAPRRNALAVNNTLNNSKEDNLQSAPRRHALNHTMVDDSLAPKKKPEKSGSAEHHQVAVLQTEESRSSTNKQEGPKQLAETVSMTKAEAIPAISMPKAEALPESKTALEIQSSTPQLKTNEATVIKPSTEEESMMQPALEEAKYIFKELDKNEDGSVSKIELLVGLKKSAQVRAFFGLPAQIRQEDTEHRKALEQVFQSIDRGNNKSISWKELEMWLYENKHLREQRRPARSSTTSPERVAVPDIAQNSPPARTHESPDRQSSSDSGSSESGSEATGDED